MTPERPRKLDLSLIFPVAVALLLAGSLFMMTEARASRDARAVIAAIGAYPKMFATSDIGKESADRSFTVRFSEKLSRHSFRDPAFRRYLPATCAMTREGGYLVTVPGESARVARMLGRSEFCEKAAALDPL